MIPIMNEIEYVEGLVNSSTFPEKTSVLTVITYFVKYYFELYDSCDQVVAAVCNKMNEYNLNIDIYQEYKFKPKMMSLFKSLADEKIDRLKTYDSIPLYKTEYEKVMSCETDKEKKLLFTLFILARHTNRYGWVYIPRKEIFKLANISYNKDCKSMIRNLLQRGLIKNTKKVDDTKIGVDLADESDEIIMEVKEITSLGNQFLVHIKQGYKLCECCNKMIKIKSKYDGSTRYCKYCADKNRQEKRIEYNQKYYIKSKENEI